MKALAGTTVAIWQLATVNELPCFVAAKRPLRKEWLLVGLGSEHGYFLFAVGGYQLSWKALM